MKLTRRDALQKALEIQNAFNSCHEILYVGQAATNEEIRRYICEMRWSCIFTSRTDPEFSGLFCDEKRTPREYSVDEASKNLLSRKNTPILRVFGIEGEEHEDYHEDLMEEFGFIEPGDREPNVKFLDLLPGMLDCVNLLLVIGYDSSDPKELDLKTFASRMVRAADKSIWFFGVNREVDKRLLKLAERKQFSLYEDKLSDIMDTLGEQFEEESSVSTEFQQYENIFFNDQSIVSIADSALQKTNHFATLLTEQEVHRERPQGRSNMQLAFSNFLQLSSMEKPQWYGYLDSTHFYLDRPYYNVLYYLTTAMLKGKNIPESEKNREPVILEGSPASSKSIMLAKLAYQVYQEHEYPVIFIKNDKLIIYSGSEELDALNLLMSDVQKAGDKDSKILLVWDCSSHRNVADHAKNLIQLLENLGRRFVLVCSAYAKDTMERQEFHIPKGVGSYFYKEGCYYVEADRFIDECQKADLYQLFQNYSGIPEGRLNQWWERLKVEAKDDIFMYFYKMITLLQEPLRDRLTKEQRIVGDYVQGQLDRILEGYDRKRAENSNNIFTMAGIDPAGLVLDDFGEEEDTYYLEKEEAEYDLERFNACIALFSQFKILTPYNLGAKMLTGNHMDNRVYSAEQRELFQLLTTQIPWIYYGRQSEEDDFTFSFRNTMEAAIFLEDNNIIPEKQIEIVCELIRLYGEDYRENRCEDEGLKSGIQQLLRMIGPNTDFQDYSMGREAEHRQILQKLGVIIDELKQLRTEYAVADEDGSFTSLEVTFMREYFGWKWDEVYGYDRATYGDQNPWEVSVLQEHYNKECYESRLKHLEEAIHLAVKKLEKVRIVLNGKLDMRNRRRMVDRRNSLTNEMVLCNLAAEEIQTQYKNCCTFWEVEIAQEWEEERFVLPYRDIFRRMQAVIDSNPTNGYYYNTLMKVFMKEYGREKLSEHLKMEYLSEMNMIIDPLDSGEIPIVVNRGSRGRDELGEHIAEIRQMAANYIVTIRDIEERKESLDAFYRMYDQMMEINNPTAILFVCRQELREEGILKQRTVLSEEQRAVCARVAAFMRQEENMRCIGADTMAMAMLIRVAWMEGSGYPLSNLQEANLVAMPKQSWRRLMNLCSSYEERANGVEKPSIMLIYALSVLQITGDYLQCKEILGRIREKDFFSNTRMRVPYIYCDDERKPYLYTGEVLDVDGNNGQMRLNGLPRQIRVKFNVRNLGPHFPMPKKGDVLDNLELGIGYTGFALYKEEGRRAKAGV